MHEHFSNNSQIISVVGATGLVGSKLVRILSDSDLKIEQLHLFSRFPKPVHFRHNIIATKPLQTELIRQSNIVFNCANEQVANELKPMLGKHTYLIDKSSAFRQTSPLIVPPINQHLIKTSKIISSPNCIAIPLALSLHPLLKLTNIELCCVTTYQSVSGAGAQGLKALAYEQKDLDLQIEEQKNFFGRSIVQNIIPQIGPIDDQLSSSEERKIAYETCKILDKKFVIHANCARVGVPIGHSAFVTVLLAQAVPFEKLEKALSDSECIVYIAGGDRYLTPKDIVGEDFCVVSRLRINPDNPKLISFWFVCDNVNKGAAFNAFEIAQNIISNLNKVKKDN